MIDYYPDSPPSHMKFLNGDNFESPTYQPVNGQNCHRYLVELPEERHSEKLFCDARRPAAHHRFPADSIGFFLEDNLYDEGLANGVIETLKQSATTLVAAVHRYHKENTEGLKDIQEHIFRKLRQGDDKDQ